MNTFCNTNLLMVALDNFAAMKKHIAGIALFALLLPAQQLLAWGKTGHGLVAEVAFSLLDTATQNAVHKYLGDMTIEYAANYMDELKNDHRNDYMKQWHYVNIDEGAAYEETKEDDIINQLTRVISELQQKDKMSAEDIKKDLLVIFHLIGDLHQPLHVGYGKDKGGNTVQLQYNGHGTNLHRLWDSEIIDKEKISLDDCLAVLHTYKQKDIPSLSVINVRAWMEQPRKQLPNVYSFADRTIDDAYVSRAKPAIEQDIAVAGIRLAAVLKDVFKPEAVKNIKRP